jgi:predicted phage tail protein
LVIRAIEGQINESSLAQSLATRIQRVEGDVNNVTSIQRAVATLNNVTTTKIETVNATIGDLSTTVQQEVTARVNADNSLFAQYTVKIDQNGHVSGFGLASETVDGTTTSAFIIRADKFAVVDPSSTANDLTNSPSDDAVPFAVVNGTVYLKAAMIQDATITSAKIASLVANKITAGYINAVVGINGGKVYGGEFFAGGTVSVSTDGSGNVTGFTPSNPTVKIQSGNVTVVASSLKVSNSATGTPTDYTPFEVVNGVVYIKSAMIQNASITLAKIDTANITSLSSIKANMGTITAGKMQSSDGKFVIDLDNKTISIEV